MAEFASPERITLPDSKEDSGERPFVRYIPEAIVDQRTAALAGNIGEDYLSRGIRHIHMITLAVGGMFWSVPLSLELQRQHPELIVTHGTVRLGSYGQETTTSGTVRDYGVLGDPVGGRHLFVVDEVVDTGNTMSWFIKRLTYGDPDSASGKAIPPASIAVAALVDKVDMHNGRVTVNYPGVAVQGNPWLVGVGMDHEGAGRALPAVYQSARPQDTLTEGFTIPQTRPFELLRAA